MRNGRKKLVNAFVMDTSLQTKLLWIFFVLIVLPLAVFIAFTFIKVNGTVRAQTFSAAQKGFDVTTQATESAMKKLDSVLDLLTGDPLIYRVASSAPTDHSYVAQMEDVGRLATLFNSMRKLAEVDRIRLYVKDEAAFAQENRFIFSLTSATQNRWYRKLTESGSNAAWLSPDDFLDAVAQEQNSFSAARIIYDPSCITKPLAVLRVDIHAETLEKAFHSMPITQNSLFVLFDAERALLYSGAWQAAPSGALLAQLHALVPGSWQQVRQADKDSYAQVKEVGHSGWHVAVLIPQQDMLAVSSRLCTEMLFLALLVGTVAFFLALGISRSTVRRLQLLAGTMERVETGEGFTRLPPEGKDEVGRLMQSFNSMMSRMEVLMEEKYAYGKRIKSLELKALQAQINPHFLYNSLDLINCMAIKRQVPEITAMVNALAKFYKLSLSRGRDVISVEDELAHAELYIRIQNMRFENSVTVIWEIDPAVKCCEIIKIVLQPIIENAIIHGIFETERKNGTLIIKAWRTEQDVFICVQDDGVGMTAQEIVRHFTPAAAGALPAAERKCGYGVRNIQERLQLAYGSEYGLLCESEPGKGTRVTLHIPVQLPEKRE